ncbi:MAG: SMI1/KNR4 family protein [Verrucomicrobiota bacterium]
MTEVEIARIESECDMTFPQAYREWALRLLPFDEELEKDGWWMCADVDEIISNNRDLRAGEWFDGWPAHLFCIGNFECNLYVINLDNPSEGVFYIEHGEEFDPADYSEFHWSSFEDFFSEDSDDDSDEKKIPCGLRFGWVIGLSQENVTMALLENFSLEAIEAEVRRLDGFAHAEIVLFTSPTAFPSSRAAFRIAGKEGEYYMEARVGDNTFHFVDPAASPEPVQSLSLHPDLKFSNQLFCKDVSLVIEAVHYFHETGGLLPKIEWQLEPDRK